MLSVNGEEKRMGFYTTRYVEAESPDIAETIALQSVREKADGLGALNDRNDPPTLLIDETEEISDFDGLESLEPGFGFYDD